MITIAFSLSLFKPPRGSVVKCSPHMREVVFQSTVATDLIFLKQVGSDSSTAKHSATGTSVMGPRRCLTLIYGILGYFPDLTLFWLFMYQIH